MASKPQKGTLYSERTYKGFDLVEEIRDGVPEEKMIELTSRK